jgi:two-component system, chemotaxis family, protein-glutamate methylesterase/glutaminase
VIDMSGPTQPPLCGVAIGASAGGLHAVKTIIGALPADLAAAVFVVLHLDPHGRSLLPTLLAAATALRSRDVRDGGLVETGTIYVAVPDRHLIVLDGHVRLVVSDPVHYARPAIDCLFESVARSWQTAAVGVVLTGNGIDGAAGIAAIKRAGGATIAQDPIDAEFPRMPCAAIATGFVDSVLPLARIASAITGAVAVASAGRAA